MKVIVNDTLIECMILGASAIEESVQSVERELKDRPADDSVRLICENTIESYRQKAAILLDFIHRYKKEKAENDL